MGGKWQVGFSLILFVLVFSPASSNSALFTLTGTIPFRTQEGLSTAVITETDAQLDFHIPPGLEVLSSEVSVHPGFVWNNTVYGYRKTITFTEPANHSRLNEKAVFSLSHHGHLNDDCTDLIVTGFSGRRIPYDIISCNKTHARISTLVNVTYNLGLANSSGGMTFVDSETSVKLGFPSFCENHPTILNISIGSINSSDCWRVLDNGERMDFSPEFDSFNLINLGNLESGFHELELGCYSGGFQVFTGEGDSSIFLTGGDSEWVEDSGIPVGNIHATGSDCQVSYHVLYGNPEDGVDKTVNIPHSYTRTWGSDWVHNSTSPASNPDEWACTDPIFDDGYGNEVDCSGVVASSGADLGADFYFNPPPDFRPTEIDTYFYTWHSECTGGGECNDKGYNCKSTGYHQMFNFSSGNWEVVNQKEVSWHTVWRSSNTILNPVDFYNPGNGKVSLATSQYDRYSASACGYKVGEIGVKLTGSQVLSSSQSVERTSQAGLIVEQNESLLSLEKDAITLADASSGWHVLSIRSDQEVPVLVKSNIGFRVENSSVLTPHFSPDKVVWTGVVDVPVPYSRLVIEAPRGDLKFSDSEASYADGEVWVVEDVGEEALVEFNFTAQRNELNIDSVGAPRLVPVLSGASSGESSRACFDQTCYLRYDYSSMKNISSSSLINLNELVSVNYTTFSDGVLVSGVDCLAGDASSTSREGECSLSFEPALGQGWNNITLLSKDPETWDAAAGWVGLTATTLNVSVSAPSTVTSDWIDFEGVARRSGVRVNGTVYALLVKENQVFSNVTLPLVNGSFSGRVKVAPGEHYLRVIAMESPDKEQIWGLQERLVQCCREDGGRCSSDSDCCGGYCCDSSCSSTQCYESKFRDSGSGGSSLGGGVSFSPPSTAGSSGTEPRVSEFLSMLSKARSLGSSSELRGFSEQGQALVLAQDYEDLEEITREVEDYAEEVLEEERVERMELNSSLFLKPVEREKLRGEWDNLVHKGRSSEWFNVKTSFQKLVKERREEVWNKLSSLGYEPSWNDEELVSLLHGVVFDIGTPEAVRLYERSEYVNCLDYLRADSFESEEDSVVVYEPGEASSQLGFFNISGLRSVLCAYFLVSFSIIPASLFRHFVYWN